MLLPVLQPPFDPTFSASSFGFRPGQSAHDAVRAAQHHIHGGCAVTGGPRNAGTSSDRKAGFGATFVAAFGGAGVPGADGGGNWGAWA